MQDPDTGCCSRETDSERRRQRWQNRKNIRLAQVLVHEKSALNLSGHSVRERDLRAQPWVPRYGRVFDQDPAVRRQLGSGAWQVSSRGSCPWSTVRYYGRLLQGRVKQRVGAGYVNTRGTNRRLKQA